MSCSLRPAVASDAPFLTEMLVAAAFWRPDGPQGSVADVVDAPEIARYIQGWPRPGDLGVVAVEAHQPVGAAWLRSFSETEPGYGFVDEDTPELSVGVARSRRGRGVGGALIAALVDAARDRGVRAISLSVESDNPARRLYERWGFRTVAEAGGARTMLLSPLTTSR